MKDIGDTLKIVNKKEAEQIDKTTNVSVISELAENKYMIRYKGQISDYIRKTYKNKYLPSNIDKPKFYSKLELRT